MTLITAGLVIVKKRKLLLAFSKNKKAWYLPSGKTEHNESTSAALIREIKEELNIDLGPDALSYYMHVSAPAFGEKNNIIMEQDCFLYELSHNPKPSAEIEAFKYFDTVDYSFEPSQVPGVIILMNQLKKDNLIN